MPNSPGAFGSPAPKSSVPKTTPAWARVNPGKPACLNRYHRAKRCISQCSVVEARKGNAVRQLPKNCKPWVNSSSLAATTKANRSEKLPTTSFTKRIVGWRKKKNASIRAVALNVSSDAVYPRVGTTAAGTGSSPIRVGRGSMIAAPARDTSSRREAKTPSSTRSAIDVVMAAKNGTELPRLINTGRTNSPERKGNSATAATPIKPTLKTRRNGTTAIGASCQCQRRHLNPNAAHQSAEK